MDPSQESDASLLWGDVLQALSTKGLPAATRAMLDSCVATSMDDETFHVSTTTRFVQRSVSRQAAVIEAAIEEICFMPLRLVVDVAQDSAPRQVSTQTELTSSEVAQWNAETRRDAVAAQTAPSPELSPIAMPTEDARPATANPLVDEITENDSKLTFARFVDGPQNKFAFEAAKQVANGGNKNYNPLFIYGKSGLGKTHLLRAIQNYIAANDPSRTCVYRVATDFIDDYTTAMRNARTAAPAALAENYRNVDVLIIDDIQLMSTAAGTIGFFFDTFNYLVTHGKQIVMAADRTPTELGLQGGNFDERVTSRLDSGVTVGIQVPDYEMKLQLIDAFYQRMREDARREHIYGLDADISEDMRKVMAERAGTNIRMIEGFVQSCLMQAFSRAQSGSSITREDVISMANQKWPTGQRHVTVEQIQSVVESEYGISHDDITGPARNKSIMEPRQVAMWLAHELTDHTLAEIGKRFGGRTHATVTNSLKVVEKSCSQDPVYAAQVDRIREIITEL